MEQKNKINLLNTFTSELMRDGKKSLVQKHIQKALNNVYKELNISEDEIIEGLVKRLFYPFILSKKRVGRYILKVPAPITKQKATNRVFKFIAHSVKFNKNAKGIMKSKRRGIPLNQKLSTEIIKTIRGNSISCSRMQEYKDISESNKAFMR